MHGCYGKGVAGVGERGGVWGDDCGPEKRNLAHTKNEKAKNLKNEKTKNQKPKTKNEKTENQKFRNRTLRNTPQKRKACDGLVAKPRL